MNIVVLNGSPKGKYSITLQSARYLDNHFKDMSFTFFNVGHEIKKIEFDINYFNEIMDAIKNCDCVLWCYPVYTFLVPYQLVKFISLIFDRHAEEAFNGKYVSQLSTSKHFYDHTAYNYIWNICEDLNMKHIHGHYADMDDIETEIGRNKLLMFGEELKHSIEKDISMPRKFKKYHADIIDYIPSENLNEAAKNARYDIALVTDCKDESSNLYKMINVFVKLMPNPVRIINISDFKFHGGCLGCFNCTINGKCIYKDGFDDFYNKNIASADCVIMAASIDKHWFNPLWKCYDDRQFANGHRTVTMGKVIGYIISGSLSCEPNLREVIEARSEVGKLFLSDIVTDEYETSAEITKMLSSMVEKALWALDTKSVRPVGFLGVGGMKIFRDLIYVMRGLMKEDHRFYKKNNFYDFPQRQFKRIFQMKLVGLLMISKKSRSNMLKKMNEYTLKKYDKIIDKY